METLFGSHSSKYFHSSFILAKGMKPSAHDTHLASINSFIHSTVVKKGDTEKVTRWLVHVSWYDSHLCRVWFGWPTDVWNTISFQDGYIPISEIQCRVVCSKSTYKFGSVIGEDSVYITSPVYL